MPQIDEYPLVQSQSGLWLLAHDATGVVKRVAADDVGGGVELGYAEAVTDWSMTATTFTDVTGIDFDIVTDGRPIYLEFSCLAASHSVAAGRGAIAIVEDGNVVAQGWFAGASTAGRPGALSRKVRRQPSAGSHNYKLQARAVDAGTFIIYAESAILAGGPIWLNAVTA